MAGNMLTTIDNATGLVIDTTTGFLLPMLIPCVMRETTQAPDMGATREDWAQWGESIVNPYIHPAERSERFKRQAIQRAMNRANGRNDPVW